MVRVVERKGTAERRGFRVGVRWLCVVVDDLCNVYRK
jgi:hypothetical protein